MRVLAILLNFKTPLSLSFFFKATFLTAFTFKKKLFFISESSIHFRAGPDYGCDSQCFTFATP